MSATGHQKGLWAETAVGLYLLCKGYRLLVWRYKTRLGEVDLIAKRGKTIVFIEVKLRKSGRAAAEAIHAENQQRVRRAAELYLQKHPEYTGCDVRFDAVVLAGVAWPQHIRGAF